MMRKGTLSKEEYDKLSDYLVEDKNIKDCLIIGILSSVRLGLKDLTELKVSNLLVEHENGEFQCKNIVIERKGKLVNLKVEEDLERVIKEYLTFRCYKDLPHDYLLFSERKQPFTRSGIYRRIKRIFVEIDLKDASLRSIMGIK